MTPVGVILIWHFLTSNYLTAFNTDEDIPREMILQGKEQYELLRKRSDLPNYGNCWKHAVDHVEDNCRVLSEETQSNMALRLTNCFLEESGHKTYNCDYDRKPNLRRICLEQMSDRAFNVYTEFYTHTQNICWFLRAQIWHEVISENTLKVGKQLKHSAINQDKILFSQEKSLQLQAKLLRYGQSLEKILKDFETASEQHTRILSVMSNSLGSLQSWLIGELSWFDSLFFFISTTIFIGIFTANSRTVDARLPLLFLFVMTISLERYVCSVISLIDQDVHVTHKSLYKYIWSIRKLYLALVVIIIFYKAYSYKNLLSHNNIMLKSIYNQNLNTFDNLIKLQNIIYTFLPEKRDSFILENDNDDRTSPCMFESIKNIEPHTPEEFSLKITKYNLRSSKKN